MVNFVEFKIYNDLIQKPFRFDALTTNGSFRLTVAVKQTETNTILDVGFMRPPQIKYGRKK